MKLLPLPVHVDFHLPPLLVIPSVHITVALYTISQRFQYHIWVNNFLLANVHHVTLAVRSILKPNSIRLRKEDCFITQMSLLQQLLIEMLGLFLEPTWLLDSYPRFLHTVKFLCFRVNWVNIPGVSTDKATRKSLHKLWRNLQFSFLSHITLMLRKIWWFFRNSKRKKKPIHVAIAKKLIIWNETNMRFYIT